MAGNHHDDDDDKSDHRPDIWIESQKLLKTSLNVQREHGYLYGYSTLVFIGSHFGGKSSIINRFIDQTKSTNDLSKYEETIALEYRYLCRQIDSSAMDNRLHNNRINYYENNMKICNIWELGHELLFIDLLKFTINNHTIINNNVSLIIVIDLTQPNKMATLLDNIIKWIRKHLQSILSIDHQTCEQMQQLSLKRSIYYRSDNENNENRPKNPLLIPVTIIGSKYDEYQNMDPEIKKQITRYLRTISYELGGQIIYHSNRSDTLTKRVNQAFESLAFDRLTFDQEDRSKPSVSTNIAKPILLPFGYDTVAKIGIESTSTMDQVRQQFEKIFPQIDLEQSYQSTMGDIDPRFDTNFAEPEIDKILEYKYMLLDGGGGGNKNRTK
nr:LOW QUALITY PROTEIN: cytoplasmic dynein 2 light intermediate chain 1-like [Dermatophagoides farinae]